MCADTGSTSPVKELLGSVPPVIRQDAVRGQALALQQQGDAASAEALLAEVVQAEQQFAQVQHLAQADYGRLLHEQGKLQVSGSCLHLGPRPADCGSVAS